jgi:sulfonate transport system substrate-binding protein
MTSPAAPVQPAGTRKATALFDLLVRFAKVAKWAQDHPAEWAQKYAAAVGLDLVSAN